MCIRDSLQLKPEIYASATLATFEGKREKAWTPRTAVEEERAIEVAGKFLPPLELMDDIPPEATPATDDRLVTPILQEIAEEALVLNESLEEDLASSSEDERPPTTRECLINIAAKEGNVWKDENEIDPQDYLHAHRKRDLGHLQLRLTVLDRTRPRRREG